MAETPTTLQKLGAEFFGTGFLTYIGAGTAAATFYFAAGVKPSAAFTSAQLAAISFAFMFAVVGAVYAIGHISGGHINPAVTLSLAVSGKFAWREVPGYMAAQVAGAIAGAAAIYLTLGKAAAVAAGGGVTHYASSVGFGRGLAIEALGTFILVFVVFGVIDHRAVPGWAPMAIGGIVFAIIMIVGAGTGAGCQPLPSARPARSMKIIIAGGTSAGAGAMRRSGTSGPAPSPARRGLMRPGVLAGAMTAVRPRPRASNAGPS